MAWTGRLIISAAAVIAAQDKACEDGDGQCPAAAAPLRWRGFPYKVSKPVFARTIYGGAYVSSTFKELGFEGPVEGDDWDILWTHRIQDGVEAKTRGARLRLTNHCKYFGGAGDKCALARHIAQQDPKSSHRHFRTYELTWPEDKGAWHKAVQAEPSKYWVLKPCLGGASKGIQILRGQEALDTAKREYNQLPAVAQEYLERPFLGYGGRKFHLRLYILATDWAPVRAYLYDDGLVFRSLQKFGEHPGEHDVFSSISKTVEALSLSELWEHLDAAAVAQPGQLSSSEVRARIGSLLAEVLGSRLEETFGDPKVWHVSDGLDCFDLFGADVILDSDLMPLVMEVNAGPNMWIDDHGEGHQAVLAAVKAPMIRQVIQWASLRLRQNESAAKVLTNFTQLL